MVDHACLYIVSTGKRIQELTDDTPEDTCTLYSKKIETGLACKPNFAGAKIEKPTATASPLSTYK